MQSVKHDVEAMLKSMPENSTIDDIHYQLYVLDKVRRGRDDIANGRVLSSEEAKDRLDKWLTNTK